MSKSKEKGFTLKINFGDRIYHLMAESETERVRWVSSLLLSAKNCKELNKGNVRI